MAIDTILIVNKSGGLIYQRTFDDSSTKQKLSSNDYLILASTLHSVFALTTQVTPKAVQLSQSNIDFNIPYIPNIGMNPAMKSTRLGSYKGDDYFKESFQSWNKSGLRQLTTDQFTMYIYQTLTGLKFITISGNIIPKSILNANNFSSSTNLGGQIADNFLRKIYCAYTDYVMKDPFYSMEMPVKSELFDKKVKEMVENMV